MRESANTTYWIIFPWARPDSERRAVADVRLSRQAAHRLNGESRDLPYGARLVWDGSLVSRPRENLIHTPPPTEDFSLEKEREIFAAVRSL